VLAASETSYDPERPAPKMTRTCDKTGMTSSETTCLGAVQTIANMTRSSRSFTENGNFANGKGKCTATGVFAGSC
jgi:hypothetical protein